MTSPNHPRRLSPLAPPGTLLMRTMALARMMRAKEFNERDAVYMARLRTLPCIGCGRDHAGEAHHVKLSSGVLGKSLAMGRRPADRWSLPHCPDCHRSGPRALHKIGEAPYWQLKRINPLLLCVRLYAAKADPDKMRAIVLATLNGR
jgi:hypothetical protein